MAHGPRSTVPAFTSSSQCGCLRADRPGRGHRLGEWTRTMEINVLGLALLCRAVLPHMKGQALRQDHPDIGRRRHDSPAMDQRVRRIEGRRRPLCGKSGARGARGRHRRECHRARRAQHSNDAHGARRRPVGRRRRLLRSHVPDRERGWNTARDGRWARDLSRGRRERRHHGPSHQRALGSLARPAGTTRRPREGSDIYTLRRITPADRGQLVGREVNLGVGIIGCGAVGRKRAGALPARRSSRAPMPTSRPPRHCPVRPGARRSAAGSA